VQDVPKIDRNPVGRTLDETEGSDWLASEHSRNGQDRRNVQWSFGANAAYLKSVF